MESWLPIPDFEGYEASSLGRIRSVPGWHRPGAVLKQRPDPRDGYLTVRLSLPGKPGRPYRVHKLVALAFLGPRPTGLGVRHLDDDKANNTPKNLVYGTQSENMHDKVRNGRHHNAIKTHCKRGHEFDEKNTYFKPDGARRCKQCARDRDRLADAAKRLTSTDT